MYAIYFFTKHKLSKTQNLFYSIFYIENRTVSYHSSTIANFYIYIEGVFGTTKETLLKLKSQLNFHNVKLN